MHTGSHAFILLFLFTMIMQIMISALGCDIVALEYFERELRFAIDIF
jgi:hypothetical protein